MCIIIDSNTFHCVFDPKNEYSSDFQPVRNWLKQEPKAKLVYGGTKYKQELSKLKKYFQYLVELRKMGRIAQIDDKLVDIEEGHIKKKINESEVLTKGKKKDFDDPHIIAILIVSGCRLFCSKDKRADKYLKMKTLYPKHFIRPSIYRDKNHIHLLSKNNIIELKNQI